MSSNNLLKLTPKKGQAKKNGEHSEVDLNEPIYRTIPLSRQHINSQIRNMGLNPKKYKDLNNEEAMDVAIADSKKAAKAFTKERQKWVDLGLPSHSSPSKPVASSTPFSITPRKPDTPTASSSTIVRFNAPSQPVTPTASSSTLLRFNAPLQPINTHAPTALFSINRLNSVIPSSETTSPSTLAQSNTPLQPVASSASSAPTAISSITQANSDIPSSATAHTPVQSNSTSKSVATNVPDMLYVTYDNKTYPVHVESSTHLSKVNGGTRKHKSNKRKTRKRLH